MFPRDPIVARGRLRGGFPLCASLLVVMVSLPRCGSAPVYDEEIGVQAVAVSEGALAGTFAVYSVTTTLVEVPLLGDEDGGGVNYLLVNREYDSNTGRYSQESQLCGGYNVEVAGVTSSPRLETYLLVPPSLREEVEVDHQRGTYEVTGRVQLWGVSGLEDPLSSPMPATASEAERREMVYDMDGDGKPGVTAEVTGIFTGQVFFIQRKFTDLSGVILGPDRSVGLTSSENEIVMLGDTFSFWDPGEGAASPHPDLKRSWFEERRLPESSECEAVLREVFEGGLGESRPF